jgi:hypothetical protein
LKKESSNDEIDKKTKPVKINQKGQYYDENIKAITDNSGMEKRAVG